MTERATMTVQEAANYLGVSKDLVYSMTKAGEIPAVKIGRRVLLRKNTIDGWMLAQELKVHERVTNSTVINEPNLSVIFSNNKSNR